jgi:PAS domain S-box-containing protein
MMVFLLSALLWWTAASISRESGLRHIAEQDVRESEARHRALFEVSVYGILTIDERGTIESVNPAGERLFGYSGSEIIGCNISMLMPEPYRGQHDSYIENYLRTGVPKVIGIGREVAGRRKDGSTFPIELAVSEFQLRGRRHFKGIVSDISARKEAARALHKSEELLRTLVEQMPAGIGVMDTEGHWLLTNATMDKYMPIAIPATLPHRTSRWRAWDDEGNPVTAEHWPGRRALRGEIVAPGLAMLYTEDDGRDVWLRVSSAPLKDETDRITGAIAVVQDITALKRAEQAMLEADRRKDEFLALLSHELRNPLAPIRMAAGMLQKIAPPDPPLQQLREVINRQVSHMARLLEDLLDVSRISTGKITLLKERVSLELAIKAAVEAAQPLLASQGHVLVVHSTDQPIDVHGDLTRLAQVFTNLLNNAAKYTDRDGRIEVSVGRDGADVVVRVSDNGIGIRPEQLTRVFDLFTQTDTSLERSRGGLGIGLSIARKIVELHGGSIEARSAGLGMGSEFMVRIAAVIEPPISLTLDPIAVETLPSNALRIVVADDSSDAVEMLSLALGHSGHDVRTAVDGHGALDLVVSFEPHIAVLDIGMPRMNGYEVAREIRKRFGNTIGLVALTGWGQEEDRRRAEAAGFDFHLTKPIDLVVLDKLLRDATQRAGLAAAEGAPPKR